MYDIAIIGAGPAGSTLARLVARKHKLLLIDKRRFDDCGDLCGGGKSCGGLLAPDAQAMLSKMRLGLPKSVLVEPQLFVVRAIDLARNLECHYQRYYINMDRLKFDRWLASMVPVNVDMRSECRFKSYCYDGESFGITATFKGQRFVEKAKILVAADGASSILRRQSAGGHPKPREYFSIQEWVETRNQMPCFSSIFDREITDYYCWTIPKEDMLLVGAALEPKNGTAAKFELLKNKLKGQGFAIGRTIRREGAFILRPTRPCQILSAVKGIAFIGEAAGLISPSSAEGLSYAFRSAVGLAEALGSGIEGFERRYAHSTRELRIKVFVKNLKSQMIYRPLVRAVLMKARINALDMHDLQSGTEAAEAVTADNITAGAR